MNTKPKLNQMSQTHGQDEQKYRPTTLAQIWGDDGLTKYGTMDEDVYANQLRQMNKADLQAHATKVGLVPVDDRERLVKRLMHEFKLYVSSYRHPAAKATAKNTPIPPEVAKILAEGR